MITNHRYGRPALFAAIVLSGAGWDVLGGVWVTGDAAGPQADQATQAHDAEDDREQPPPVAAKPDRRTVCPVGGSAPQRIFKYQYLSGMAARARIMAIHRAITQPASTQRAVRGGS
jgi:hypothetical protein